ncbi:MAG: radical SAM protein [Nanoarchaeota archaeon]
MKESKNLAYERSIELAGAGLLHPVLTCVRLTRDCDIRCDYCSELFVPSGKDLGFEAWKKIADIVYALGNRDFVLTGGEPMLMEFVIDLVEYAASRDSFVSLATNGRLLTAENLAELDDAGLDYLGISVDYFDDAKTWGKNLTPELRNTLEHIAGSTYQFQTQVATVVSNDNLLSLPNMVGYFSSLGMPTRLMLMMTNKYNAEAVKMLEIEKDSGPIKEVIDELLDLKRNGALIIDDEFTLERIEQFQSGEKPYHCKGGQFDLSINNDGRLVACPDGIITNTNIFSIDSLNAYQNFIEECASLLADCPGCLWSHKQRLEDAIKSHIKEVSS